MSRYRYIWCDLCGFQCCGDFEFINHMDSVHPPMNRFGSVDWHRDMMANKAKGSVQNLMGIQTPATKYGTGKRSARFELAPSDTKKRKTSSIVDEKVIADKNLKSTATSNANQATAASKETALENWWIGKLGISNLKSSVTKEDLYELFGSIGEVQYALIKSISKSPKSYGVVMYKNQVDAVKALSVLNGTLYKGNTLEIRKVHGITTEDEMKESKQRMEAICNQTMGTSLEGVSRTISNSTSTCCDVVIDLDDNSNEDVIILDEVKNSDDNSNEDVIILDEVGPSNEDVELLPAENINFESSVVMDIVVDPSPLENIMAEPSLAEDIMVKQSSVNDIRDDTSSAVSIVVEQSVVENIEVEPSPTVDHIITKQLTVGDITDDTSSATSIMVEPSVVGNIELESSPTKDKAVDASHLDEDMIEPAFEDDFMIELSSDEEMVNVPNEDRVVHSSEMSKNRIDLPETVAESSPRENLNESMCEHPANEDSHMEYSNQAIGLEHSTRNWNNLVCVLYHDSTSGDDLFKFMSRAGQIAEVKLVEDQYGKSAYFEFAETKSVVSSMWLANDMLNGKPVFIKTLEPFESPPQFYSMKTTDFHLWWYGKLSVITRLSTKKQAVLSFFKQYGEILYCCKQGKSSGKMVFHLMFRHLEDARSALKLNGTKFHEMPLIVLKVPGIEFYDDVKSLMEGEVEQGTAGNYMKNVSNSNTESATGTSAEEISNNSKYIQVSRHNKDAHSFNNWNCLVCVIYSGSTFKNHDEVLKFLSLAGEITSTYFKKHGSDGLVFVEYSLLTSAQKALTLPRLMPRSPVIVKRFEPLTQCVDRSKTNFHHWGWYGKLKFKKSIYVDEAHLRSVFEQFGEIDYFNADRNHLTKWGIVVFRYLEDASRAYVGMKDANYCGYPLQLTKAGGVGYPSDFYMRKDSETGQAAPRLENSTWAARWKDFLNDAPSSKPTSQNNDKVHPSSSMRNYSESAEPNKITDSSVEHRSPQDASGDSENEIASQDDSEHNSNRYKFVKSGWDNLAIVMQFTPIATQSNFIDFWMKTGLFGKIKNYKLSGNGIRSKGTAYIEFLDAESQSKALAVAGMTLCGKPVLIRRTQVIVGMEVEKPSSRSNPSEIISIEDDENDNVVLMKFSPRASPANVREFLSSVGVSRDQIVKELYLKNHQGPIGAVFLEFSDYDSAEKVLCEQNWSLFGLPVSFKRSTTKLLSRKDDNKSNSASKMPVVQDGCHVNKETSVKSSPKNLEMNDNKEVVSVEKPKKVCSSGGDQIDGHSNCIVFMKYSPRANRSDVYKLWSRAGIFNEIVKSVFVQDRKGHEIGSVYVEFADSFSLEAALSMSKSWYLIDKPIIFKKTTVRTIDNKMNDRNKNVIERKANKHEIGDASCDLYMKYSAEADLSDVEELWKSAGIHDKIVKSRFIDVVMTLDDKRRRSGGSVFIEFVDSDSVERTMSMSRTWSLCGKPVICSKFEKQHEWKMLLDLCKKYSHNKTNTRFQNVGTKNRGCADEGQGNDHHNPNNEFGKFTEEVKDPGNETLNTNLQTRKDGFGFEVEQSRNQAEMKEMKDCQKWRLTMGKKLYTCNICGSSILGYKTLKNHLHRCTKKTVQLSAVKSIEEVDVQMVDHDAEASSTSMPNVHIFNSCVPLKSNPVPTTTAAAVAVIAAAAAAITTAYVTSNLRAAASATAASATAAAATEHPYHPAGISISTSSPSSKQSTVFSSTKSSALNNEFKEFGRPSGLMQSGKVIFMKYSSKASISELREFVSPVGKIVACEFFNLYRQIGAYLEFVDSSTANAALALGGQNLCGEPVFIKKADIEELKRDDKHNVLGDHDLMVSIKFNRYATSSELLKFLQPAGRVVKMDFGKNELSGTATVQFKNIDLKVLDGLTKKKLCGVPVEIKQINQSNPTIPERSSHNVEPNVERIERCPVEPTASTEHLDSTVVQLEGPLTFNGSSAALQQCNTSANQVVNDSPTISRSGNASTNRNSVDHSPLRLGTPIETMTSKKLSTSKDLEVNSDEWHGRLAIQLDAQVEADELWDLFEPFGDISYASTDDRARLGFVKFCDVDLAIRVMELLNGVHFRGFPLNIRKAQGSGSADDFEAAEKRKNALMQSQYQHLSNDEIVSSPYLLATNMFDMSKPTEKPSGWNLLVNNHVFNFAATLGVPLVHLYVDKLSPQGSVYMVCRSLDDAGVIVKTLHGRLYGGRRIQVDCLPQAVYYHLFPEVVDATCEHISPEMLSTTPHPS